MEGEKWKDGEREREREREKERESEREERDRVRNQKKGSVGHSQRFNRYCIE